MSQTVILHGNSQKAFAVSLIEKAPPGAVLTIREAGRSVDQNSKLWAMLSDVSRAMPSGRRHTPEVWKTLFMHACGHAVQFEMGLNGQPFPTGFRSSKLTKTQMGDLIESIYSYGAEWGVVWTEPDAEERAA
jgi:hypothetical protein